MWCTSQLLILQTTCKILFYTLFYVTLKDRIRRNLLNFNIHIKKIKHLNRRTITRMGKGQSASTSFFIDFSGPSFNCHLVVMEELEYLNDSGSYFVFFCLLVRYLGLLCCSGWHCQGPTLESGLGLGLAGKHLVAGS